MNAVRVIIDVLLLLLYYCYNVPVHHPLTAGSFRSPGGNATQGHTHVSIIFHVPSTITRLARLGRVYSDDDNNNNVLSHGIIIIIIVIMGIANNRVGLSSARNKPGIVLLAFSVVFHSFNPSPDDIIIILLCLFRVRRAQYCTTAAAG